MTGDLKLVTAAVSDSEQRLRQITDNLPALISYIDKEQRVRFANSTYRTWLDADPQALLGQHMREVFGPEIYARCQGYLERALGGERLEFEREAVGMGVTRTISTSYGSWTSTTSSPSTTAWGTPPATVCCRNLPASCRTACAFWTWWHCSAETSSW